MQTPIYLAQDEMELMSRLWSPTIKDDPLEKAQQRVIEGLYTDVTPALEDNNGKQTTTQLLHAASERLDAGRDERDPVPSAQSGQQHVSD